MVTAQGEIEVRLLPIHETDSVVAVVVVASIQTPSYPIPQVASEP